MTTYRASNDRKIGAAIGAAVLQVGLGALLINGFTVTMPHVITQDLKLFGVTPPPPPPPPAPKPQPKPKPSVRKAGAAAPPNLRSKATEVVAPPPRIPIPVPPPVVVAPIAATGNQATSGASDRPGPGTGAGGRGNGTGSGDAGDGDGGGVAQEAYQKSGRIRGSDYPRSALRARVGGTVYVNYTVEVDGHATGCTVRRSSGNPDIDATTCRLIEERYRYEPARDASGRKIRSRVVNQDHTWVVGHDPSDDSGDDRDSRDDRDGR
jgi:periplasmic protein TonB